MVLTAGLLAFTTPVRLHLCDATMPRRLWPLALEEAVHNVCMWKSCWRIFNGQASCSNQFFASVLRVNTYLICFSFWTQSDIEGHGGIANGGLTVKHTPRRWSNCSVVIRVHCKLQIDFRETSFERGQKKEKWEFSFPRSEVEISSSRGNRLDAWKFMIFMVRGRY